MAQQLPAQQPPPARLPAQAHTRRACGSLGRSRPLGSTGRPCTGLAAGSVASTLVGTLPALTVPLGSSTSALLLLLFAQPMLFECLG